MSNHLQKTHLISRGVIIGVLRAGKKMEDRGPLM